MYSDNVKVELLTEYTKLIKKLTGSNEKEINLITPACKNTIGQIIYHIAYYESFYFNQMLRRLLYNFELNVKSFVDIKLSNKVFTLKELYKWLDCFDKERINNVFILDTFYEVLDNRQLDHEIHGTLQINEIINKVIIHDKHHFQQICESLLYIKEIN